jgi:hypothetical protein
MTVYYITKCGCEVDKSGLKKVRYVGENGKGINRMGCKRHGDFVESRKTYCSVCGEPMTFGLRGQCSDKCPEHSADAHREAMRDIKRIEGNPYQSNKIYPITAYPRTDKYIPEASLYAHQICYDRGITGQKHEVEKTREWSDFFINEMNRILHDRGLRVL